MSDRKYLSWDIEIVKEIPEDGDWLEYRPLGISCAATLAYDSSLEVQEEPIVWYAGQDGVDTLVSAPMARVELNPMLDYMVGKVAEGYSILTWNGLKFDFDVLAEESGMPKLCAFLAMTHVDVMYQFFCMKGFPCALAKAAQGLGLPGKTEGMTGAVAPVLWAGSLEDRQKVLRYVAGDVEALLAIVKVIDATGLFKWVTTRGITKTVRMGDWLTVKQASNLPVPDNSWMDKPMLREDFYKWTTV